MPTLHLICGLPCSGKTTLGKRLEQELPALRLCPDEWMYRIVSDGYDQKRRDAVEAEQWNVAARALALGVNVILENGFWERSERDQYRARAKAIGMQTKLHYLEVPMEELKRRLAKRNAAMPPDTFHVSEADLVKWAARFDVPTEEELK